MYINSVKLAFTFEDLVLEGEQKMWCILIVTVFKVPQFVIYYLYLCLTHLEIIAFQPIVGII